MIYTLIDIVRFASNAYSILILARVVISWVHSNPSNPVVAIIYRVTEPVLGPVRNLLPAMGGMDFSPILALVGVQILENVLVRILIELA